MRNLPRRWHLTCGDVEEFLEMVQRRGMVPRRTVGIVTFKKNVAHEVKTFKMGKLESIVMAGEKVGEVGILKDCDGLIKIVKKSVQNHCKRTSGTLDAVEDELNLRCTDDVTGRAPLGAAVRCARKVESIYLRDLGVCEKVNERSRMAGRRVDADWRPSPRSTCRRGGERTQSPGSQALMLISHKVGGHIVENSKFHVQMSWSRCEQSVDVTVPEVSKQFVTRFADVPLLLAVAENVEACLSCWKRSLRWRVWCCRNACSSGSTSNLLM